jgi:GR25 family glycosyltransferase involved in LPS biosynthesis
MDQTQKTYTIDTYFDKVLYINMPGDEARNQAIVKQLNRWGITNYERVEGVKVNSELVPVERYRNFIKSDPKYINGSLGCAEAHLKCIKLAKNNSWNRVLILEDDIEILQDPNKLLNSNQHLLNDWDLLFFGGLIEPEFRNQIVCAHAYGVNSSVYDDIIYMARPSGMEIDNFYAKIIQQMSYNHNQIGKRRIRKIEPFNQIVQNKSHNSNIR